MGGWTCGCWYEKYHRVGSKEGHVSVLHLSNLLTKFLNGSSFNFL